MKKLKCIIVDDEPVARKIIREFIGQLPYLVLAGEFENATKTEYFLKQQTAEILFLDIQMPKISGIDWLKKTAVQPLVILTTAFSEHAAEGYELDIIDYLLKPIAYERFVKAVEKAREYITMKKAAQPGKWEEWLFVRTDRRIEKVQFNDILYVESMGNYIKIVDAHRTLLVYMTLKGFQDQLPPGRFVKIHQSFLVNFSKITTVDGHEINVEGKRLPLSRGYKEAFMRLVDERLLKR